MESPIFSEDSNIFPAESLISASALATTIEEKLVLPKEAPKRFSSNPVLSKHPRQIDCKSVAPLSKRSRVELPVASLYLSSSRDPRSQKGKGVSPEISSFQYP